MKFVKRDFKFVGMRKPQDFIIYPTKVGDETVLLQSDTRIMKVYLNEGKAILSASHANGSYGPDLSPQRGAKIIVLSEDELDLIKEMQREMSGETIAEGDRRSVVIVGKSNPTEKEHKHKLQSLYNIAAKSKLGFDSKHTLHEADESHSIEDLKELLWDGLDESVEDYIIYKISLIMDHVI